MNYRDILNLKFSHLNWTINDPEDYFSITWEDSVIEKEHLDKLINDAADSELTIVLHSRKDAYPSIEDQLDMMFWDEINGTTIWKDTIQSIKNDNPKP